MNIENQLQLEIQNNIRVAVYPIGDRASLGEREQAANRLLAQGKAAYDALIKLIQEKPESMQAGRLIELLSLFKKKESITLLNKLLAQGKIGTARAAGRALAVIDSSEARQALESALLADDIEVRIAAIDAVRFSGGKLWCSFIGASLQHKHANLRYYAVNSAAELGCLDADQLHKIVQFDDDKDVRQIAQQWINNID